MLELAVGLGFYTAFGIGVSALFWYASVDLVIGSHAAPHYINL